jgi:HK97 family phage prohead protease
MPYFIESDNPDCSGWATVKDDGEVMGCHLTKGDAIDQMVALSLAEDIEPGGERMMRDLPDAYRPALSDDVPEGRACGNCAFYNEQIIDENGLAFCDLWEEHVRGDYYCDRWQSDDADARSEVRQVDLDVPVYIRDAASRGLELRAEGHGGDGLTDGTIREAGDMADGQITEDKVVRANAWAARHAVDLDAPSNTNTDDDGWPGAGAVAHYLWGIDPLDPEPARNWFERKAAEIQEERTMGTATITRSKEDQVRQLAFDVAPNEDGLTLDGYGAVFNEWTVIEDEYGQYRERIMPGAFRRTLGQRMPILQFDHGTHPLIGSIPLGRITQITEDDHGLRVKARLSDNWLVQPVRDAIRDGGITGMSFRFRIVNEKWGRGSDGMEERSISEVALYEVGPVVFPAYEQTSVGVRSRHVLRALEDAEIRDEIARIMASGTDLRSLATDIDDDPDTVHSSDEPSTVGHGSIPTRTQRIARMRLAGIIKE